MSLRRSICAAVAVPQQQHATRPLLKPLILSRNILNRSNSTKAFTGLQKYEMTQLGSLLAKNVPIDLVLRNKVLFRKEVDETLNMRLLSYKRNG